MPIHYANKKALWPKLAIAAWIVLGTLAYGHSYNQALERYSSRYEFIIQKNASLAALFGPIYWLSVAGVAIFEESK